MIGWTLRHEVGLALVPPQYRAKVKEEFALSDKKMSGGTSLSRYHNPRR